MLAVAQRAAIERVPFDRLRWGALVRIHGPFLQRSVARLTGENAVVDDVVQEAFITAFKRQTDLPDEEVKLRAWLYRAARNHLMHAHRGALRERRKRDDAERSDVRAPEAPDEQLADRERADRLRRALLMLHVDMREAFILVEMEALSAVEAAALLAVPENTLRSRLRRAREHLVEILRPEEIA